MSSIILNPERIGSFTSSNNYRLVGFGTRPMTKSELEARPKTGKGSSAKLIEDRSIPDDKFYTYIKEKKREKRAKRSINTDVSTFATAWGDLMELMIHQRNDLSYKYSSKKTTMHPTIIGLSGSNDFITDDCIIEAKGYQPSKFFDYYECLEQKSVNLLKSEFPQEYWQMVSGAVIHGVKYAEAVLYMPYFKDLPKVYEVAMNIDTSDDIWQFKSICDAIENERYEKLAYLPNDSGYKDEIRFRFEVPKEDFNLLTDRVKLAIKMLNE